ncbi:hypothetical protein EYF80_031526 [Liparis tanakae]|uniref:Uncharacterized protein n=1 Tax=Liparis tanakae TaxID=230148 RepID=A0A4Z2GXN4_9TELE|nr:hypothetical protein EYF80_031526 [Liparis tanakae]
MSAWWKQVSLIEVGQPRERQISLVKAGQPGGGSLASAAGWLTISQLFSLIGNQSAADAASIKGAELEEKGEGLLREYEP